MPAPDLTDYVLLCDKPAGITSHDVVAQVRRTLPRKTKVGHAGTLDPFATGLLLVLVGRATRVQRFLMALTKRYEAVARFGAISSTGDPEGEMTATGQVPDGPLVLPTGRIRQRPPAYSAVKVDGQRAYRLARAGIEVELAEREVEVHRFEERWHEGERRGFLIECSSGTYVRSLIAALGDAYCEELRRTRIGSFDVGSADPERPVALVDALGFLPAVHLDADTARRAGHGAAIEAPENDPVPGEIVRLLDADGLIALARPGAQTGTLKPFVGLR
ncbi:MAG: tRNA pseudouridine(55) synthase TruB [Solirubrobacteraceae bacterium]